eukprot:TRINITY_DN17256_c0_g1_i1.p1 TRINITY_DN17256_c0_g1~~TRINITY_DN17256_c0_g1_i1.p1  ORF type:complete len:317 (+),score=22.46 TRINITY_DN17256_c0_g1_i1:354-1304(+)
MHFKWRSALISCASAGSMLGFGVTAYAKSEHTFNDMRGSMVRKFMTSSNGNKTLSAEEFAKSVLQLKPDAHIAPTNIDSLRELLGSDEITLEEYKCFLLLLGASYRELSTAFAMFDISNNGLLSPSEYELFFKSFNGGVELEQIPPMPPKLDDLITTVRSLTSTLARIEFNQFGELAKEIPSKDAARHLGIVDSNLYRVSDVPPLRTGDWADLMKTARREIDICFALHIFEKANQLTEANFLRVINRNCRVGGETSSKFLWSLFYDPDVGQFNIAEFQNCLRSRKHFGVSRPDYNKLTSKRNVIQSLAHCMQGKAL